MEVIGELLEPITTNLYAWRIPIAFGSAALAVVLGVIAWRRDGAGWTRRNPVRAGALVVAALLVGGPVAWYLASPVVLRTSLVEPAPTAIPPRIPSVPASSSEPAATSTSTPTHAPAPALFVARTIATGEFSGTDDFHFGRGTASVIEFEPGRYHLRLEDFSVRNGPDLFVYLSPDPDGYADGAIELGRLKATDGAFGYDLPEDADPADFASAIVWCKQFAYLFAVAPLEASIGV